MKYIICVNLVFILFTKLTYCKQQSSLGHKYTLQAMTSYKQDRWNDKE